MIITVNGILSVFTDYVFGAMKSKPFISKYFMQP